MHELDARLGNEFTARATGPKPLQPAQIRSRAHTHTQLHTHHTHTHTRTHTHTHTDRHTHTHTHSERVEEQLWLVFTQSSIGEGKMFPKTHLGRLATVSVMIGVPLINAITTGFITQVSEFQCRDRLCRRAYGL